MLSEEEKKVIEELKNKYWYVDEYDIEVQVKTILNLIEKQNRIIDKMAEDIVLLRETGWLTNINNKQDAIEYYTKLVEEKK